MNREQRKLARSILRDLRRPFDEGLGYRVSYNVLKNKYEFEVL